MANAQDTEQSKYTINIQDALPFGHDKLYLNLTLPITFNKKIPITLFVSDSATDVKIGAYIYTIGRGKETFNTVLNQSSQDSLELASKISRALCLKYETPVYLNINGSYDPFEFLGLIKLILNYVNEKIESAHNEQNLTNSDN